MILTVDLLVLLLLLLLLFMRRVDDLSFFDCLSPFCLLLIDIYRTFFYFLQNITILCLLLLYSY